MRPNKKQARPTGENPTGSSKALKSLVAELKRGKNLGDMLHPALGKIDAYDRENKSDFLYTLKVYLDNDCNAQQCGRLLFLHRNSLVYRIRRIQDIAECDLSDPDERAYLRISLLLW